MEGKSLDRFRNILRTAFQEMQSSVEQYKADGKSLGVIRDYPSFQGYQPNGMPRVGVNWYFRDSPDYMSPFSLTDSEGKINVEKIKPMQQLKKYVDEEYEQFATAPCFMNLDLRTDEGFWVLEVVILTMFDSYMHRRETKDFDESAFSSVTEQAFIRIFDESLPVSICVPILLVQFPEKPFDISSGLRIRRLSENELVSAAYAFNPHSGKDESQLLTCASHILEIHNIAIQNTYFFSDSVYDCSEGYPREIIDIIDLWFVSLQIIKHFTFGYGAVMAIPHGWGIREGGFLEIHGAKMQKYPDLYLPKYWPNVPRTTVTAEELERTSRLFSFLFDNDNHSLELAAKRLFTASLRANQEDAILDLVIGTEALTTDNEKGDTTYKVSMRSAYMTSCLPEYPYDIIQTKDAVSTLYSYRSAVAHGRTPKEKEKTILMADGKKLQAVEFAAELLRFLILSIERTPDFLDVKKVDQYLLRQHK